MADVSTRYAVVTGANKGIGLEICKQLASKGITVVLTARDEKKGIEAVENLKKSGLSNVVFHQLDVADPASIPPLADYIKRKFGKLDILVNNAGILGLIVDGDGLRAALNTPWEQLDWIKIWIGVSTQTYNLAEECIKTNYYGARMMCETFIPLLELSDSPRIVNVSSGAGRLKNVSNKWAKEVLSDVENLTEEKVDQVLSEYMKDFKEGSLEAKAWPPALSAYVLSKASMTAYTRILAKKHPSFRINCVCPGYVKTEINCCTGNLTVEEGAEAVVRLALLSNDGPSGLFFLRLEESEF